MALLNTVLGTLFDLLLSPFRSFHPMIGLTVVSTIAAVLMLLGYRATSNQPAIEAVKRKIAAGLFEIRLFNDDLGAILRAQRAILRHNLTYLGLNLAPMLVMIVPFFLVLAQLQFHYAYRGLAVGEVTTLRVTMADGVTVEPDSINVVTPEGVRIDSPRVWAPSLNEAAWRLVAEAPGRHQLDIQVGDASFTKSIVVSEAVERRAPERLSPGFVNQLIYPAEAPLPDGAAVTAIRIDYPDRVVGLFGLQTHWMIVFFILTIAIAFALKGRFGVTI